VTVQRKASGFFRDKEVSPKAYCSSKLLHARDKPEALIQDGSGRDNNLRSAPIQALHRNEKGEKAAYSLSSTPACCMTKAPSVQAPNEQG